MPHEEKINVLIVDDRPDGLLTLEAVIESPDYNLIKAKSGKEALALLFENEVALVLLDVQMPDLDGFETAALIKQNDNLKDIPIIFVTAINKDKRFVYQGYDVGAIDYIFKPFDPQILQSKVAVFAELHRKTLKIKQQAETIKKNEQLERDRQVALKASQAKSEFLSSMSHDIRTPMNCIVGMADLLTQTKLSEEQANYVQMLNKSSDNLLGLVNNILDLSKIESGRFTIENRPFDLLEAIELVIDIISPRAHAKGLEIILEVQPDVPRRLQGDPDRLKQILINLLGNAIKFTKKGETSLKVVQESEDSQVRTLSFSVKDSGIGIPQNKISMIFEHFTQLQVDTETKREGSGLGLSICRELAKLMGGSISVESEVGKGSSFQVKIPFAIPKKTNPETNVPPLNFKNANVMIIEDNAALCLALSDLFAYWGANVRLAHDINRARQLIKSEGNKIQVFLIDVRLPGVKSGGLDLVEELKSEVDPGSVIMMLPTNHRHGDLERIKALGIGKYFIKPAKAHDLGAMVSEIISQSTSKSPSRSLPSLNNAMKPLRLLVADDSEENRFLIESYFKNTPFDLVLVENGEAALEKFKARAFDLVLLDIQMPLLDGYGTLRAIRKWEKETGRAKTPVIALTAFALKEESERCLAAGFRAHITKPIRKNQLIDIILSNAA